MAGFSAFVLNLSKSDNIFQENAKWNLSVQLSIIVIDRRDNTLVHELWVMTAVELHVKATYHAQYPALKSVMEKTNQWLRLVSCFPPMFYRIVFSRFQDKWIEVLLQVYEALCTPSLSSVLIGLFQKNTNRGLRMWNFQGYWRRDKWIFWGAN